jgi:hypothetical protein
MMTILIKINIIKKCRYRPTWNTFKHMQSTLICVEICMKIIGLIKPEFQNRNFVRQFRGKSVILGQAQHEKFLLIKRTFL